LKFRGREMAHTEVGFEVIKKFIELIAPFGHPDFQPKLVGKAINLMISPLPRNKRAKNPRAVEAESEKAPAAAPDKKHPEKVRPPSAPETAKVPVAEEPQTGGLSTPFAGLEIK